MHQSGSLQNRQRRTTQPKKQGTGLHPSGIHPPQRTVGRTFHCRSTPRHNGKIQGSYRTRLAKKATPIREGVIVISEDTTLQQLQNLAEKLEERFGVHAFQIYTHKDEGANVWNEREEAWKPNYHAHMIFDWTDGHTGKTAKLNKHDMAEMQTITAECLNMERGVSSDRKHLSAMQYKNQIETEKAGQLQKDIEQLSREYSTGTQKVNQVLDELDTARKELKSMKTDIHINEAKEAAAKAGKTVFNAVTSVFNVGEVKKQAKKIEDLKKENYDLSFKNQNLEGQLKTNTIAMQRTQETADRQIKAQAAKLKPITELFPEMENAGENIEELRSMGVQNNDIRQLLTGKEIYYTGNLYDKDKRKSYQVKNVKIDIAKNRNNINTIWLNDIHFKNFLKEHWNNLQKILDPNKSNGIRL